MSTYVKQLVAQAGDKGVVLTLNAATATRTFVLADIRSLMQIYLNLLSNAVKFTEAGGHVLVVATVTENEVRTQVTDTGMGIPANMLDRVLEPFTQVHSNPRISQAGTGLGLTIVDSLVAANGGQMKLESAPGEGTTVTVTFPRLPADDADRP